ncbi:MAG: hypothetical protein A2Y66_01285 [Nitrospirae bacterium RBG_13_41_22]|nr:MAG: hypothetical protein A2Y66_01285 [Nitrospirae bacterium RBG_13_41_22]
MGKSIAFLVSLLFVLGLSAVSFAKEEAANPAVNVSPPAEVAKEKPTNITGEIKSLDAKAGTLTVKGKKGEVTVSVDSKTKIVAGKDVKTFADLKAGERVRVKYQEAEGKNIATKIHIYTVAAKQKAPAEKKTEEKSDVPAKSTK